MRHQFHENVKFCPKCGLGTLVRDLDHQGHNDGRKEVNGGTEWWCRTCGFSFKIGKSRKWYLADALQREDRQLRVGKPSDNTNPAIRDAYVRFLEKKDGKGR